MRIYAHIGKGAVVMLNSDEIELIPEVMRSLALEYNWPDAFPPEKPIITLSAVDRYLGSYLTKSGLQFQVTSQDGNLYVQYGQQPPLQFSPTSELEFLAQAVNTNIIFEKDDTDKITAMTISQAGVTNLRPTNQQIRAERRS